MQWDHTNCGFRVHKRGLNPTDFANVKRALPFAIRNTLIKYEAMLGGGFIRSIVVGEKPKDIDLFVKCQDDVQTIVDYLVDGRTNADVVAHTDNAITVIVEGYPPIQIIKAWTFDNPRELLKHFDFTVCKAVFYFNEKFKSVIDDQFYEHLASKRLVYTPAKNSNDAGASFLRLIKYIKKGFKPTLDTTVSIIVEMTEDLNPSDYEEYEKQIKRRLVEIDPSLDGGSVYNDSIE